jgi:competence protein ComEC
LIEPPATANRFTLLPLAACFAAGIAFGRHGPELTWPWVWFLALLTLILLNHRLPGRHSRRLATVLFWLLFGLAGLLRFTTLPLAEIPSSLAPQLGSGQEVVISGRLNQPPSFDGRRGKILLAADQHWQKDGVIAFLNLPLPLSMPFAPSADIKPGDRILVRATLQRPAPPGNPGTFDYRRYLADRSILATGFIRSPANLTVIHESDPAAVDLLTSLSFRVQRWRQQINLFIAGTGLDPKNVGLYQALLTGDRSLLPLAVREDFKNSGLFHLLAISGMHLALLAMLSGLLINLLLRRWTTLLVNYSCRKITAALVLLVLCLYAVLAGLQPPVTRALIMAAAFIAALLLDRPTTPGNSLGLAALLTLAWQPAAVFQASFQLSYLAVVGILGFTQGFPGLFSTTRPDSKLITRMRHWLVGGLVVSSAAVIAIAPLTSYHFGQVTLLSPVSTLLVAPFLCFWALPLGLVGVLVSTLFPTAAEILLQTGALGLTAAQTLASILASLPLASWQTAPPPLILIPLYYATLAILLFGRRQKMLSRLALPLLVLAIGLTIYFPGRPPRDSQSSATFLDVGQGAATLLELAEGQSILVDGGSITNGDGEFDLGEQIIAPFLRFRGLTRLDALVVSHDHADHYNGLPYIIKNFRPRKVWLNRTTDLSPGLAQIMALAEAAGSSIRVPEQGEILLETPTSKLTCLSSFHLSAAGSYSENSRSLVLELQSWGQRIILPADIMTEEGEILRRAGLAQDCAVLLAPHHGSDNSASLVLSRACRPAWLVISAGSGSSENFPGPELLAWSADNQTRLHRTGVEGAISFNLGPNAVTWQKISAKAGTGELTGNL